MAEEKKMTDLLGLAPYGEAINTLAKGAVDGVGAFLSKLCLPATGQVGLLLEDIAIRRRRLLEKSEKMTQSAELEVRRVPFKLVAEILDRASVEEDEELHTMWAALLANAAANPDSAIPAFTEILSQLSRNDALFIEEIYRTVVERDRRNHMPDFNNVLCGGMLGEDDKMSDIFINAFSSQNLPTPRADDFAVSKDNLIRLRLIQEELDIDLEPERLGHRITVREFYRITQLGGIFILACQPPEKKEADSAKT